MMRSYVLLICVVLATFSCGRDTYGDDAGAIDVDATDANSIDARDASYGHDARDASPQDVLDTLPDTRDTDLDPQCAIPQCAIENTPDFFDHTACTPFNCGDILAVCIDDGEDSEFELNASLGNVGKFRCGVSNTRCIAANTDCNDGICCVLDQLTVGTFEREYYPEMCEASDLIRGFGCIFLP